MVSCASRAVLHRQLRAFNCVDKPGLEVKWRIFVYSKDLSCKSVCICFSVRKSFHKIVSNCVRHCEVENSAVLSKLGANKIGFQLFLIGL